MISAVGTILMKIGAMRLPVFSLSLGYATAFLTNLHILLGFLLYLIPAFLWVYLLGRLPVSVVQPILALTYVVTPLLAMIWLGEGIPALRWLGIGTIVAGVAMVGLSQGRV